LGRGAYNRRGWGEALTTRGVEACKGVTPFPLALRGRAGIGFEAKGTWDGVRTRFEAKEYR